MSAMSQPTNAMMPGNAHHAMVANNNALGGGYNPGYGASYNNNGNNNGYIPSSQASGQNGNGMVPTPFTAAASVSSSVASAVPNGHLNGPMSHSSPRMMGLDLQGQGHGQQQYYWNPQQQYQ